MDLLALFEGKSDAQALGLAFVIVILLICITWIVVTLIRKM